jgi:hypothetical protein
VATNARCSSSRSRLGAAIAGADLSMGVDVSSVPFWAVSLLSCVSNTRSSTAAKWDPFS